MDVEEAHKILEEKGDYACVSPLDQSACLDGYFSVRELRAIIFLLESGVDHDSLQRKKAIQ